MCSELDVNEHINSRINLIFFVHSTLKLWFPHFPIYFEKLFSNASCITFTLKEYIENFRRKQLSCFQQEVKNTTETSYDFDAEQIF